MKEKSIELYDNSNMRKLLIEFPQQVENSVSIAESAKIKLKTSVIQNIIIAGLGGSAIGGDLIRTYLTPELKIPVTISRHYSLPRFVDKNSLVIVSSYSGNTEETIASYKDAVRKKAQVLCITSGGEIEAMAKKYNHQVIKIPSGLPPRAALGYSFFPILVSLIKLGFIKSRKNDIKETISYLNKYSKIYKKLNADKNKSLYYAQKLYNHLPVIYSSTEIDSVNVRWRGQLCENSKILAFGHTIPEMNHNELVGWKVLKRDMENMVVVYLKDKADHDRIKLRMNIMNEIIKEYAAYYLEINSEGKSFLTRIFSLIYLGDWISYYLAIINGIDPTPVRVIDYLKTELSKVH